MIDKSKNIYLTSFLRKQNSEKMSIYFTYPPAKDESIVDGNQIVLPMYEKT